MSNFTHKRIIDEEKHLSSLNEQSNLVKQETADLKVAQTELVKEYQAEISTLVKLINDKTKAVDNLAKLESQSEEKIVYLKEEIQVLERSKDDLNILLSAGAEEVKTYGKLKEEAVADAESVKEIKQTAIADAARILEEADLKLKDANELEAKNQAERERLLEYDRKIQEREGKLQEREAAIRSGTVRLEEKEKELNQREAIITRDQEAVSKNMQAVDLLKIAAKDKDEVASQKLGNAKFTEAKLAERERVVASQEVDLKKREQEYNFKLNEFLVKERGLKIREKQFQLPNE